MKKLVKDLKRGDKVLMENVLFKKDLSKEVLKVKGGEDVFKHMKDSATIYFSDGSTFHCLQDEEIEIED